MIVPTETRPSGPRQTARRVLIAGCEAASLGLLAYLITSRVFYREFGLGQEFGVDRILLLIVIAGLVVLRRLAARLDPRLTLVPLAIFVATGAGVVVLPALGVNLVDRIRIAVDPTKSTIFTVVRRTRVPAAIYRLDDRYGLVHAPNTKDWARGRGFTAMYTIDAAGHREIPSPAAPQGTVVFLGDSMTFGAGVNDDETYSYVLATEYWRDLRIVNAAVDGWGLTQCLLALTDLLSTSPLPSAVILAIIPDDLRRSHLRPPVIRGLQRRLEWISRGRDQNVEFGVALLNGGDPFPPDLTYFLGRAGVATADLTRLGATTLPDGAHPDAPGHRLIATALAASPLTAMVRDAAGGR